MVYGRKAVLASLLVISAAPLCVHAQREFHGRKYQAPPPTGHIVVTVEKAFNGKPMENVAVIFHSSRNGKDDGSLEIKSNSQGKATMDLLEVGSHVEVQVIANGYATSAQEFDLTDADVNLTVKMLRPREQVSVYEDNDGKAAVLQPGIQEPNHIVANNGPKATTATLSGTIKDDHGARVPGAVVTMKRLGTSAVDLIGATDSVGNFKFSHILPGTYDLQVNAPGYALHTHRNIALSAGNNEIYDEQLQVADTPAAPARSALPIESRPQ